MHRVTSSCGPGHGSIGGPPIRLPVHGVPVGPAGRYQWGVDVQFGRYYEEFEVGAVYKHWPGKTVTEYDDHLFCLLTMNHHPLHMDAHYAEETTDFGRNVVVGNYVYSLLLGMSVPDVSGKAIANLEVESLKHTRPTFHGDTIYGETEVLDKTDRARRTTAASSTSRPAATSRTARWCARSGGR